MNKLFITSILTTALVMPAMADNVQPNISPSAESADCTQPVLGTTSGTSNLQANWTANTLNLEWYNGNTKITPSNNAAKTCTYDGGITVPSNTLTKTGYTFAGWHIVTAVTPSQQTPITLSSLYDNGNINVFASKSLNPGEYCEGSSGWDDENDDYAYYGTDEQGETACSVDSRFSGLNNGEWTVTMPNGNIVKGVSTCSTQHPTTPWYDNNNTFTSDNFSDSLTAGQYSTDNSSGMKYCWCKATSGNTGSGFQSVASSSWVFSAGDDDAVYCALTCARYCAGFVSSYVDFRRAVFGTVLQ